MKLLPICSSIQRIFQRKYLGYVSSRTLTTTRIFNTDATPKKDKFFITTPIFYVNSVPHIGHLYTALLADAVSRWYRIRGTSVLFTTGTDEHGLKIQQAAVSSNKPPQQFCDEVSASFRKLFQASNIEYDDYIRTTEERHKKAVHHLWRDLERGDYIYKGGYQGWYSVPDEAFLTEGDVEDAVDKQGNKIKISKESGHQVEWMEEENYKFRLSKMGPALLDWLKSGVIQPRVFQKQIIQWVESGLPDLSISRESSRLRWGIPVPEDPSHTIYVWLDALVNYLSVTEYPEKTSLSKWWPADVHVVGKDILQFHAVYWPAFLMAAGLEPPRKILCHSHWTVDNVKMSKSLGNVVDPFDRMGRYSTDGLRYFLLREGVPHSDGNYSDKKVVDILNSELCNTMGNLLSRCTAKSLNPAQEVPKFCEKTFLAIASEEDKDLMQNLSNLPEIADAHYRDFNIYKGLECIMAQLRDTNAFVHEHKPWEMKDDMDQKENLDAILFVAMQNLRVCAILLQPVVPMLADKILNRLGAQASNRAWNDLMDSDFGKRIQPLGKNDGVLFKRMKIE